jgi:predicted transcriptional regulator
MDSENVDIIPVVDAGKIIGVVRSQDVLSEFARLVR